MKIIRTLHAARSRSRPARAKRNIKMRFSKLKKFEEFEDISNSDLDPHGRETEVSSTASPRSAFDIVSEYLSHSTKCDEQTTATNDNPGRYSDTDQNEISLSLEESAHHFPYNGSLRVPGRSEENIVFRRKKQTNSTRRSSSRSVPGSQKDSLDILKKCKPLSEVSNNVIVPISVVPQKVLSNVATENTDFDHHSLKPKESPSMPFLKTLLTSGHDAVHSSPSVTTSPSPIEMTDTVISRDSNINSHHSSEIPKDISPHALPVALKDKPTVIVTIAQPFESEPHSTSECPEIRSLPLSVPSLPDLSQDSAGVLSDVHTLIRCTALAGSDLVDNYGLANPSVISHISDTVLPLPGAVLQPASKRTSLGGSANRKRSNHYGSRHSTKEIHSSSGLKLSTYAATKTTPVRTRHPFLHFWESEDDRVAVSRGWRARRRAYLSLLFAYPEAEQPNVDPDGGRQARRRSDYTGLFQPLGKGGVYSRHRLDHSPSLTAEWNAQNQMLTQLEPMILGYRWSDPGQKPSEANRDVLLMWN